MNLPVQCVLRLNVYLKDYRHTLMVNPNNENLLFFLFFLVFDCKLKACFPQSALNTMYNSNIHIPYI